MRTVAEAMIGANAAVAKFISDAFPSAALLRRHPPPRIEAFAEVSTAADAQDRLCNFDQNILQVGLHMMQPVGSIFKNCIRIASKLHQFHIQIQVASAMLVSVVSMLQRHLSPCIC